jgi:hypothetical protein
MTIRKEREREFFVEHMPTFRALQLNDPFFVIKTAFFQKGKYGRQVQFFESELSKGDDIFIEFYENVKDPNGNDTDVVPMLEDRQLFRYKYNRYFAEEYEQKENVNSKGETYHTYTVPVSELVAVLKDGSEITHALYEKRKEESKLKKAAEELPRLQKSLSVFPDFEDQYLKQDLSIEGTEAEKDSGQMYEDIPISEITIRDLAAIMLMKPVSNRQWLNEMIMKSKSEL